MTDFQQLVDAYYQPLYRFAVSLARDPQTAADLVQETFCIWAAKGGQLREADKAKTWLFTTLHREFLSQRRRAARYVDEPPDEEIPAEVESQGDSAERQLDAKRALELLHALDESLRAPLVLFYLQQHSYREIAEILDIPIGTVMSRLARGKEVLRKRMTAPARSAPRNVVPIDPVSTASHG